MGLDYRDLDQSTRTLMAEEIQMDINGHGLYISSFLNDHGTAQWSALTLAAAMSGTDDTLAATLARGCLKASYPKRTPSGGMTMAKVPYNAPQTLAEAQFNMYYIRALARRALAENKTLVVYRAKPVNIPRPESEAMIGQSLNAQFVVREEFATR